MINFLFHTTGYMPIVAELQLHLRPIYERKVHVCASFLALPLHKLCRRLRRCTIAQEHEAHLLYEIKRANNIGALLPQE